MALPLRLVPYLLLRIMLLGCMSPALAADVPGYVADARLPVATPKVLWKYTSPITLNDQGEVRTAGLSNATVGDGIVYFGDDDGVLHAVRAVDGEVVWAHEHGHRIAKSPTVDRDAVYFGSSLGVTAVSRADGNALWFLSIDGGASEAEPVSLDDRLFFAAYDGFAYAVDRTDGGIEWKSTLMNEVPPDPDGFVSSRARFAGKPARPNGLSSDGTFLYQSMFDQSRVIVMRCSSGEVVWTFATQGWMSPAPVVMEDRVFVGSQDKHLYCLSRQDGSLRWKFKTGSRVDSRVTVVGESVYLPATDGHLYCLRSQDGELLWKFKTTPDEPRRTAIYSAPLVTDRAIYFAAGEGQLYAVSVDRGDLLWKLRPSEGSELYTNLATDGERLFASARPSHEGQGENAIIAIGVTGESDEQ